MICEQTIFLEGILYNQKEGAGPTDHFTAQLKDPGWIGRECA